MDGILYWYSQNNKLVIQLLALSIGAVLIYFIYRLFFINSEQNYENDNINNFSHSSNESTSSQSSQSSQMISAVKADSEADREALKSAQQQIDNLQSDVKHLNEKLSQKEEELLIAQELVNETNQKNASSIMIDTATLEGDPLLISKIDELQKKLSEYDIISEDIAELQNLRKENADLKIKLSVKK